MNNQVSQQNVPAISKYQLKMFVGKTDQELEDRANTFLETINEDKKLMNYIFSVNQVTGELVLVITYVTLSPMTKEEWVNRQKKQKEFTKVFQEIQAESLLPKSPKIETL